MDLKIKKILVDAGIALTGFAVIGTFGVTAFSGESDSTKINQKDTVMLKNVYTNSSEPVEETSEEIESLQFVNFKKAGIHEYDMALVVDKNSKRKKKENVNKFSMKLPENSTTFYDPKCDALNYSETRSIADEYYTIHDIISGQTVTVSAYEMICQMVNSEIGDSWGEEAIKAQAVAAYSYTRFCDSIGVIPDLGLKPGYSEKIANCVKAVEGQCVYYNGSIINAVYSASSAGYSAESEKVWGVSYPYLRAVVSEFDSEDPNYGVEVKLTKEQVKEVFDEKTNIDLSDDVENWFKADAIFSEKYIGSMTIDGHSSCLYNGKNVNINGDTLRLMFDLKSNAFTIDYEDGVFKFTTYGYGHGVGMSQWGACLYARHGYSYDQILRHYYLNTTIQVSDVNQSAVDKGVKINDESSSEIDDSSNSDLSDVSSIPTNSSEGDSSEDFESQVPADDSQASEDVNTSQIDSIIE